MLTRSPKNFSDGAGAVDGLAADRLAARVRDHQRVEDVPGAERDDERRQPEPRHEQPVDEPAQGRHEKAERDREERGHADRHGQLAHDDRPEHHDRADRQVDPGGQDDQRLGGGQEADDGDLLDDQGEVERREEALAGDDPEHGHADREDDDRHHRRVAVQEVLQGLQRGAPALEARDALGGGGCHGGSVLGFEGGKGTGASTREGGPAAALVFSSYRDGASAPALLLAFLDADRLDAVLRIVGHERDAGVGELLAFGLLGHRAVLRERGDGLHAERGHQ